MMKPKRMFPNGLRLTLKERRKLERVVEKRWYCWEKSYVDPVTKEIVTVKVNPNTGKVYAS